MKKPVLVVFGGVSAEHEVSVVTGLQALEHIDRAVYDPLPLYISKSGKPFVLPHLASRKGFKKAAHVPVSFGKDAVGGFVSFGGLMPQKRYPYAAYLALHGGLGENGSVQGLFESLDIPITSPSVEASALAMNKRLTKEALMAAGIPTAPSVSVFSVEIEQDAHLAASRVLKEFALPVIVKPAHLGSSVGIAIARTSVELEKKLIEAAAMDSEILIEPFYAPITEYNCAVRSINGEITPSPIEHPLSHDEILSFADKYERGGKKSGGGMASLSRELPAKIDGEKTKKIRDMAVSAFTTCRMKGVVRIDFMEVPDGSLYLTEINTIPGSMSFYLWEAAGIPYEQLNTELIEQAVKDAERARAKRLDYSSNIIDTFIES